MIVKRIGNKAAIAGKIWPLFPKHSLYIEMFFGAGGMFFAKPRCSKNIMNDIDGDVINLFLVVKDHLDEFLFLFKAMPLSEQLFKHWLSHEETDTVKRALRFLYLSSFSLLGKSDTFQLLHSQTTHKKKLEALILKCSERFENVMFRNLDFRDFLKGIISGEAHVPLRKRFVYADPPYYSKSNNYKNTFSKKDTEDLFMELKASGMRFAISELDTPFVMDLAVHHGLEATFIAETKTMGAVRKEMLYSNYPKPQATLF